jgi:uncharacterized BrkB/YihY/UPF0761 family membrane protein
VLALLVWVYYSGQVFLFGAEFTRVFANQYGGRIVPVHHSPRPFLPHAVAGRRRPGAPEQRRRP